MKLKSFSLTIAGCVMMLASCGNSTKTNNDSVNESINTEEISIIADDTCHNVEQCNDSIITRGGTASEGFGRCSKCACKRFEGRGDVCKNCGHAYRAHY